MAQLVAASLIEESREAIMSGPDEEAKEECMRMISQGVAWTEKTEKEKRKAKGILPCQQRGDIGTKSGLFYQEPAYNHR